MIKKSLGVVGVLAGKKVQVGKILRENKEEIEGKFNFPPF